MMLLDSFSHRFPRLSRIASRAIDPALNISIILVCILIVVAFISSAYFRSKPSERFPHSSSNAVGLKISIPGLDWSKSNQTLLMFLNIDCGFCKQSEPFYRQLTSAVTDHQSIRVVAVFPQKIEQVKPYLESAKIMVDEITQQAPTQFRVKGTPTLVLVDKNGTATNEWIGLLSTPEEAEVFTRLGLKSKPN